MKDQTIKKLMAAAAVLFLVYGLALIWQKRQTAPVVAVSVNTAGLKAAADGLTVKSGGTTVKMEKRGDKWFAGKTPVRPIQIGTLLQAMENVAFVRVVASSGSDFDSYGLDEKKANSLKVYRNKKLLRSFFIGNMAGPNSFFVKLGGDRAVYEAQGELIFEVGQPASTWTKPAKKAK